MFYLLVSYLWVFLSLEIEICSKWSKLSRFLQLQIVQQIMYCMLILNEYLLSYSCFTSRAPLELRSNHSLVLMWYKKPSKGFTLYFIRMKHYHPHISLLVNQKCQGPAKYLGCFLLFCLPFGSLPLLAYMVVLENSLKHGSTQKVFFFSHSLNSSFCQFITTKLGTVKLSFYIFHFCSFSFI